MLGVFGKLGTPTTKWRYHMADKTTVYVSKNSGLRFTVRGANAAIVEIDQEKFQRPEKDLEALKNKATK